MKPFVGYVYCITNLVSGKRYVGHTNSIDRRWREHQSHARRGSRYPLHAAIRKYGTENLVVTCVRVVRSSYVDLLQAEVEEISNFGCLKPAGYNLTAGGEGVDFSDPEIKARHLLGVRAGTTDDPKWMLATAERNKRLALDPEWRRRITESNKRKALDPEWRVRNFEGAKKRVSDPKWHEANAGGLSKRSRNKALKDAALPPDELERRLYNRSRMQRSVQKRRC